MAQLEDRMQELASRLARSEAEQEDTLRLFAYELHNGLGPLVVSARQHLDTFQELRIQESSGAEAELAKGVERLGRAVVETRRLLASLRPAAPGAPGFLPGIRALADERSRAGGWRVEVAIDPGELVDRGAVPGPVETAVYRILDEALTNVTHHAGASTVAVTLRCRDGVLRLDVADDGVGLAGGLAGSARRGLGLTGMRERARLVGGHCGIGGKPGGGTRVSLAIPLGSFRDVRRA